MQANGRSSCLVPTVLIRLNYGVDGLAMTMLRHSWARVRRRSRRLWSVSRNWSIEALLRHTDSSKDHEPSVTAILDAFARHDGTRKSQGNGKSVPLFAASCSWHSHCGSWDGSYVKPSLFYVFAETSGQGTRQAAKVDDSDGLERTKRRGSKIFGLLRL